MSKFKIGNIVRIEPRDSSSGLADFRNYLWEIVGDKQGGPDYWELAPVAEKITLPNYGSSYERGGQSCNWDGQFLRHADDCVPAGSRWLRTGWSSGRDSDFRVGNNYELSISEGRASLKNIETEGTDSGTHYVAHTDYVTKNEWAKLIGSGVFEQVGPAPCVKAPEVVEVDPVALQLDADWDRRDELTESFESEPDVEPDKVKSFEPGDWVIGKCRNSGPYKWGGESISIDWPGHALNPVKWRLATREEVTINPSDLPLFNVEAEKEPEVQPIQVGGWVRIANQSGDAKSFEGIHRVKELKNTGVILVTGHVVLYKDGSEWFAKGDDLFWHNDPEQKYGGMTALSPQESLVLWSDPVTPEADEDVPESEIKPPAPTFEVGDVVREIPPKETGRFVVIDINQKLQSYALRGLDSKFQSVLIHRFAEGLIKDGEKVEVDLPAPEALGIDLALDMKNDVLVNSKLCLYNAKTDEELQKLKDVLTEARRQKVITTEMVNIKAKLVHCVSLIEKDRAELRKKPTLTDPEAAPEPQEANSWSPGQVAIIGVVTALMGALGACAGLLIF